jgi:hypothetical protein
MTETQTNVQSPVFKDRKTGLVVFGLLHIGLGGLCALLVPLILFGMAMSKTVSNPSAQQLDTRMMVPGLVLYALLAVYFIWIGVGSNLARRWARALILVSSWLWLICGISGLIVMWLILPDMYEQMAANGQMPSSLAPVMMYSTLAFMALLYVLWPGSLVLFYGSKQYRSTCEFRNPNPSWTDACPLPVLALSLLFGFWACSALFMGCYDWVFPFFGFLLSGPAGAFVVLCTICLLAYISWGTFRLNVRAWTWAVGLVFAWAISVGLTFSRHSLMDFYAKMRFPEEQLRLMKPLCTTHVPLIAAFCAVWFAVLLGYLLYTRRFFPRNTNPCIEHPTPTAQL